MFEFLKKKKEPESLYTHELNYFIVKIMREPLAKFVKYQEEKGMRLPIDFETDPNEWLVVLNKMKYAFEQTWINLNGFKNNITLHMDLEEIRENDKKIEEGFDLFGRYIQDLWEHEYMNR